MCGIVFLHSRRAPTPEREARVRRAMHQIQHRGPDGHGMFSGEGWTMGHRRLSIVDLTGSPQPMADPSQRYWLTYNGEIYNYPELRKSLAGHWNFTTQGDTEVLLAGLIIHGAGFLEKMEGMWAFAFWDAHSGELLLARDRMGKKPLYYTVDHSGTMALASELPALRALVPSGFTEDEDSTADYLRYGYYLPGFTAYRNVYEIHPGHYARWRPGQPLQQEAYWTLPTHSYQGSRADARRELDDLFLQSLKRRLVADVEVGAFLSGGVDSSLTVCLLHERLGVTPKTFSIGFSDASFDERPYARLVAEHCGTEHHEYCVDDWDRHRLMQLIFDHLGQPFYDPSLLPTALVSDLAGSHVKVALSGDGGDELFSGYQRYQARLLMRWYCRLPRPLRAAARRSIRLLPEPLSHHSRSILKKAQMFLDASERLGDETPYIAPRLLGEAALRKAAPALADKGHTPPALTDSVHTDDIMRMMMQDALIYLPQDVLAKVDRAAMACGLESRTPFLDRELVEFAFSLDRAWHRRNFAGKRLLRETFHAALPDAIWKRRKQGFSVPISAWFDGAVGDELVELATTLTSVIEPGYVLELLQEHRHRRRDNGYRLWNVFVYLLFRGKGLGATVQSAA